MTHKTRILPSRAPLANALLTASTIGMLAFGSTSAFAADQASTANKPVSTSTGTGANSSTKAGAEDLPLPPATRPFLNIDQGKLHLTAGFNDVEGAGGAGLIPLAFITGYGSRNSWGANAHYTTVDLDTFKLTAYGVAVGLFDRVELSFTQHELDVTGGALDGLGVKQDIVGLKVKLFGDAVYLQDSWIPQVSVGAQYKNHGGIQDAAAVGLAGLTSPTALGAKDDNGTDYYLSATKIFLGNSFVVNVNLRYTEANQFGLLGFGGPLKDGYSLQPEAAVGYLFTRKVVGGVEYRGKPENLSVDKEGNAWDAFVAWTPTRNISLVAAYVNLGSILGPVTGNTDDQKGAYLSFQVGF